MNKKARKQLKPNFTGKTGFGMWKKNVTLNVYASVIKRATTLHIGT